MRINQNALQLMCEELMNKLWGDQLEIPVEVSDNMPTTISELHGRISNVDGEEVRIPVKIAISSTLLEGYNYHLDDIEAAIKHELCRYYMFKTGKGYTSDDKEFELELKRIGASRIDSRGNYKTDNNVSVIYKYACMTMLEANNSIDNINIKDTTGLTIEDVIDVHEKGGIKAKVYKALINAIQEKSAEKIRLIAKHYPDRFSYECEKFSKKRMDYIISVFN